MNPWAFLVIGIGILLVIMGVKGSYPNVVSALTGRTHTTAANPSNPPAPAMAISAGRIPSTPSGQKPVMLL